MEGEKETTHRWASKWQWVWGGMRWHCSRFFYTCWLAGHKLLYMRYAQLDLTTELKLKAFKTVVAWWRRTFATHEGQNQRECWSLRCVRTARRQWRDLWFRWSGRSLLLALVFSWIFCYLRTWVAAFSLLFQCLINSVDVSDGDSLRSLTEVGIPFSTQLVPMWLLLAPLCSGAKCTYILLSKQQLMRCSVMYKK